MDQITDIDELKGFDDFTVRLGDKLRGERATLGLSLDDVSKELRIPTRILQAVEETDVDGFPSHGYIAGNVRAYASYLGLDPHAAFQQFCDESGFAGVTAQLGHAVNSSTLPRQQKGPDLVLNPQAFGSVQKEGMSRFVTLNGIASLSGVLLVLGLVAFGASTFMKELQRVDLAPINEAPSLSAQLELPTQYGPSIAEFEAEIATPDIASDRPTELLLPRLTPREAPIATLDIQAIGAFAPKAQPETLAIAAPQTVIEGPKLVDVYAAEAAWIRVQQPDGQILFEQILDGGQRYRVPEAASDSLLKAGNAKAVYLIIGDEIFGPVSDKGSVARNVALSEAAVRESYALVDDLEMITTEPVNLQNLASRE